MPYFSVIRSEQYPATDETQCVNIIIPAGDEFKALLAGLYNLALNPANYDEPDSAQTDGLVAVWDQAYSEIDWSGCVNPAQVGLQDRIFVPHALSIATTGNGFAANTGLGQIGDCQSQSPAQINDAWQSSFIRLRAGQWNMNMSWVRTANSGQLDLILDPQTGTDIQLFNNFEMYNATTGAGRLNSATFDVIEDMTFTLRGSIPAKNASSSGYNALITFFDLIRIGD